MILSKNEKIHSRIRKDDQVQVIAGKEKSKIGKVLKVDLKNFRVQVEKINLVKRHVKPNQKNPQGGIVEKEAFLHLSNVLLFCPKCSKGVRVGRVLQQDSGKKKTGSTKQSWVRVCKKCKSNLA